MIKKNIHISENPDMLADELVIYFQDIILKQFSTQEKINIAISGGNTPALFLKKLATSYIALPWEKIHLFWVDERCVPPGDAESNYGMTKRVLLDKITLPGSNVHRILGESDPESEVKRYEVEIHNHLVIENTWPLFDWILLGLGEDGHTASLFPRSPLLTNINSILAVSIHPQTGQKRITLTLPVINNAKRIAFLVSGASKARVVGEILNTSDTRTNHPAALVDPLNRISEWFLDKDAAQNLS